MHRVDLSERVITVERELITCADVALKGRRPGERAAEYPARIRNVLLEVCSALKSIGVPSAHRNVACLTNSL